MSEVKYADKPDQSKRKPMFHHKHGLSWTSSGYGKKIPTELMVRYGVRWYRVYCCIFSNIGSLYIVKGGETLYLHEYDLDVE